MSHPFISRAVTAVSSLYRDAKVGEITGIFVEKHINGLEIDLGPQQMLNTSNL